MRVAGPPADAPAYPPISDHLGLNFFRPDETQTKRSATKDLSVLKAHYLETPRRE
jgi:hypothetical protein